MPMMDIGQLNNINRFPFIEQFKITALKRVLEAEYQTV